MVESRSILFLNFLVYALLFIFFLKKDKWEICIKNIPFLWLALVALSSYLFYIQPGFKFTHHYSLMTVPPFIYLFFCMVCLFIPYRFLNTQPINVASVKSLPRKKINLLIFFSLPILLLLFVAYTYEAANTNLIDMQSIRDEVYSENAQNPLLKGWIGGTIARLFNQTSVLLYCIAFHVLVFFKEKKYYHRIFIILPYLIGLEYAYSTATRSYILFILMLLLFQFLLYKDFMETKLKKRLMYAFVVFGSLLFALLIAMSISRFADNDIMLFMYKYAGESMVNFNGLLFDHVQGTTNGMAYFWYIPSKLGVPVPFAGLATKWAFIEGTTGVSGMFFYTIVGAFIFEFGKIITPIIIIFLSIFMKKLFSKSNSTKALIVVSWCTYNIFASVFLLPIQGDSGTLSILWLIAFYVWIGKSTALKN
ncbi:MAG: oligosaccharide repeat unit polymerase [Candidatus Saccharibacteria bacterium]|nr:oligosaccharide repeat unit polymerase [Candidatus Saccharibacteria bacterium]